MDLEKELKELVDLEGNAPVISLYLNTGWKGKGERSKARIFIKNGLGDIEKIARKEPGIREGVIDDISRIKEYFDAVLHGRIYSEFSGMALFVSSRERIFRAYHSFIPFDNEIHIDFYPHIRQLIRLLDEYEHALSVAVDSKSARIVEITLGGVVKEEEISNYVPGRHTAGGWSQMRFQRHIKDHMDKHHSEVAEILSKVVYEEGINNILLFGQERTINNFIKFLPDGLKRFVIATETLKMDADTDKILELSRGILQKNERVKEARVVKELIEEAGAGGSACLGIEKVIESANKGQIYKLIIDRCYDERGYRCTKCHRIYKRVLLECPFCRGGLESTDLIENLLRNVIKRDGFVESIKGDMELRKEGGVGAFFRFR